MLRPALTLLLTLAMIATACSGDDGDEPRADPEPGDATTSSTTSTTASPATDDAEEPAPVGLVDEDWFRSRQEDYLDHATEELNPSSILNVIAHATRARRSGEPVDLSAVTPEAFAGPLEDIRGWEDTSDFDALYLINLLYEADDLLPAETIEEITDALLGFEYWYTEPTPEGVVDNKWYWSENHRIIFHTVEFLAGQRWPDEIFRNDGRTGAEHAAEARERILAWMLEKVRFGFSEWHSDVYYQKDLTPLLTLVEWADDEELATRAAMLIDVWLFDIALHLHDGNLGATHGRSYMKDKSIATQQDTFGLSKLIFDDTELDWNSRGEAGATLFARAERYRPPAVVTRVAASSEAIVDRERMGVPIDADAPVSDDPGAPHGITFDDPANVDFWWERGAQTTWQALELTTDTLDEYGLWASDFFSPFIPLRDAFAGDVPGAQAFVSEFSAQLNFGLLTEVSSTTYRTDQVMLSTALDYRPGAFGDQTHISQATLSEAAIVFVTNPKNEPFTDVERFPDDDGYWTGYGVMPRAAQVGATSIQIFAPAYAPPDGGPLAQFTYIPVTHAYFPTEHFDEVVQDGGWTFGRQGDGYVAVRSHRDAAFVDPVPTDIFTNGLTEPFDLRADGGADNVWIVEVGDAERWGDFASFQAAILDSGLEVVARPVTDDGLPGGYDVRWESPSDGVIEFGTSGPLLVDGTDHPLRHDLRFDNPFAQVAFNSLYYDIRDDEGGVYLDFEAGTRTLD